MRSILPRDAATERGRLRPLRAPRGTRLHCADWQIEAPFRMLQNNLDPEVAEDWKNLVVYGGTGRAARSWTAVRTLLRTLRTLSIEDTLLVQSGKPVGVFRTHELAPRVLISNSMLVPAWATWEEFRRLEGLGLTMYGQMTAGSWIYIGTQGILQGTFETFAAAIRRHFGGQGEGRLIVSSGLGGMGGAQPLAATMNGCVFLGFEVDPARIARRWKSGYLDVRARSIDDGIRKAEQARREKRAVSIAVEANAADGLSELVRRGILPDLLTDQTSAHDLLNGYVPHGMPYGQALELRRRNPDEYVRRARETIAVHVEALLELQRRGAITFEYGNNLRGEAKRAGVADAFRIPGFVSEYIRPLFCEGRGPFRWAALSGDPEDIRKTDEMILREFPHDPVLARWIPLAQKKVKFQGLPARICWLGQGERAQFGLALNAAVARGRLRAPVVIGRDHLDAGSVASPYRETEGMKDGSDAIADWPILNALLNASSGATWVSVHHGGGVGIGNSIHAGMVVCADGTELTKKRLERVLTNDPGIGIARHADAGYEQALACARKNKIRLPGLETS